MKGTCFLPLVFVTAVTVAAEAAPAPKAGGSPNLSLTLKWGGRTMPNSIVFSPDGKTVVTTGDDRAIRFWDVQTGKCVRTIKNPHDVNHSEKIWGYVYSAAFRPGGEMIASVG